MGDVTDASEPMVSCTERNREPFVLRKPKLVIGEGTDECVLLSVLAKALGLSQTTQLAPYDGKDNLKAWLSIVANGSEFRQGLETLLVLRDADDDAVAAFQSVQGALEHAQVPVPTAAGTYAAGGFAGRTVRVGVLVLPGAKRKTGSLETLCYRSATDPGAKECIARYLQCLRQKKVTLPANKDKTRAYAYIAAGKRAGFAVGRAAQQGYWDFAHPAWDELKKMLLEM